MIGFLYFINEKTVGEIKSLTVNNWKSFKWRSDSKDNDVGGRRTEPPKLGSGSLGDHPSSAWWAPKSDSEMLRDHGADFASSN